MARSALRHRRGEADDRPAGVAHLVDDSGSSSTMRRRLCAITSSIMRRDQAADQLVGMAAGLEARMLGRDLAQDVAEQRQAGELVDPEHLGAQAVVDVVGVVGDVVGDGAALRLGARIAPELEIVRSANNRR